MTARINADVPDWAAPMIGDLLLFIQRTESQLRAPLEADPAKRPVMTCACTVSLMSLGGIDHAAQMRELAVGEPFCFGGIDRRFEKTDGAAVFLVFGAAQLAGVIGGMVTHQLNSPPFSGDLRVAKMVTDEIARTTELFMRLGRAAATFDAILENPVTEADHDAGE